MLAMPPLPVRRVHLAIFAEGVVTVDAYRALAAARAARATPVRPILWLPERLARWDNIALVAVNDFEDAIFPEREDIAGVRALFGDVAREVEGTQRLGTGAPVARCDPARALHQRVHALGSIEPSERPAQVARGAAPAACRARPSAVWRIMNAVRPSTIRPR